MKICAGKDHTSALQGKLALHSSWPKDCWGWKARLVTSQSVNLFCLVGALFRCQRGYVIMYNCSFCWILRLKTTAPFEQFEKYIELLGPQSRNLSARQFQRTSDTRTRHLAPKRLLFGWISETNRSYLSLNLTVKIQDLGREINMLSCENTVECASDVQYV